MDLVIPYTLPPHGDHELQFALRSACEAFDVGRVWLLGDKPEWCTGVEHRPGGDVSRDRNVNVIAKLRRWLDEAPDEFVLWNDDFYVMEPVSLEPVSDEAHTIGQLARKRIGTYKQAALNTADIVGDAFPSFELHRPMAMASDWLYNSLSGLRGTLCIRTLYAWVADHPQCSEYDRLAHNPDDVAELMRGPWFASQDKMACDEAFVLPMRARFPNKCRFEV